MKSAKNKGSAKASVKFRDLKSKKDPKGGAAVDYFLKVQSSAHKLT